jgi:branched-chain amino acid transport system ATP-binding protein
VVDLATALAHEPSVLLLDEPSSGIAQREAEALGPVLVSVREQTGAAMLVIEHDVPLLAAIAGDLVALDAGRIIARGRPDEVLADPAVVSRYLGTSGTAVRRSGRRRRLQPLAPADG